MNKKVILKSAPAFLVLIALGVSYFFSPSHQAMSNSKRFIKSLAAAEYQAAYEMTSEEFKNETSLEALQEFAEYYSVVDEAKRMKITYRDFNEGVRLFSGSLSSWSEEAPLTIEMVEEDENWKISYFSVDPTDQPVID